MYLHDSYIDQHIVYSSYFQSVLLAAVAATIAHIHTRTPSHLKPYTQTIIRLFSHKSAASSDDMWPRVSVSASANHAPLCAPSCGFASPSHGNATVYTICLLSRLSRVVIRFEFG